MTRNRSNRIPHAAPLVVALLLCAVTMPVTWAKDRGDAPRESRENRGDDDRRRGWQRPDAEPLTDQQIADGLSALKEVSPGFADRLIELRDRNPEQFRQLLTRTPGIAHRIREAAIESKRDPEGFKLRSAEMTARFATFAKARQLHDAPPDQRDTLQRELRELGEQAFDASLARRRHDLARIEQRVDALRQQLAEHRDTREKIADKLTDEALTGKLDHIMPVYLDPPHELTRRGDHDDDDRRSSPQAKRDGDRDHEHSDDDRELDEEQVEKMLAYIRQKNPELGERLARLRQDDPAMFRRTLVRLRHKLMPRIRQREDDPQAAQIMAEAQQIHQRLTRLTERHGDAPAKERDALRAKVREQVAAMIELRFKLREHEIAQINERLDRLRAELTEQEANRQQILNDRLEQLREGVARMAEHGERDGRGNRGDGPDRQPNDRDQPRPRGDRPERPLNPDRP